MLLCARVGVVCGCSSRCFCLDFCVRCCALLFVACAILLLCCFCYHCVRVRVLCVCFMRRCCVGWFRGVVFFCVVRLRFVCALVQDCVCAFVVVVLCLFQKSFISLFICVYCV